MKVEGINPADLASQYYYLDEKGLSVYFTPSAVKDNSGERLVKDKGWRGQDLQYLLDKLDISQNKFFIIRLLKRGDIVDMLFFLEKDKLINALNFFPRSKLIHFMNYLPKEMLVKMLLWVIPLRTLLQFFPTEVIFNILRSRRLDVSSMVRGFENMPLEVLQKLMFSITGQNVDSMSHKELLSMFMQLKKEQILEGMKSMGQMHLFEFIFQEVQKDPELLMMIPRGDFLKIVSTMPKPNLIDLFRLLPDNMLVMFLAQLPDNMLAMAAAQMDDKTFGSLMINQFPDLIASLALAA